MDLINKRKIFENEKFLIERERYAGWISQSSTISIYKKVKSNEDLYPAWNEMFLRYLSGEETTQDGLFKKIQNNEEVLFEEMSWDLRDIGFDEVKNIIKEDYNIELE